MPISGKFVADFASFEAAVQKAEVSLKGFEADGNKVATSLTRLGNSLQGTKLIQDATLMAAAVDKIGGVSKLTETELLRVGAQAQEAAAKMKALGVGVPENLQRIAGAAKDLQSPVDKMSGALGSASSVLASFGVGLSIGGAVAFGKALLDDADHLVKLSDKTGVTLQGLQKFQIAGDDAGNSIDDLTGAITKMEDKLVGGDAKALQALKDLKIPFEDIKNLNPENQFIAISDAIRQVQDPAKQVAIAIDLFGKAGAEVLPTLKRGFDDLKGSTVGMSDETIRAMDKAGDEVAKWWRLTKGYTAEATVAFAHYVSDGLTPASRATAQFTRDNADLAAQLKKMTDSLPGQRKGAAPLVVPTSTGNADEIATANAAQDKQMAAQAEARKKSASEVAQFEQQVNQDTATRQSAIYASIKKDFDDMMKNEMEKLKATNAATVELVGAFTRIRDVQHEAFGPTEAFATGLENLGQKATFTKEQLDDLLARIAFVGPVFQANAETAGAAWRRELGEGLIANLKNVPASIASAFTSGGNIAGALASVGSQLGATLGEHIGKGISSAVSGFGALAGPIGAAIGSLAGPLIDAIVNIGGPSKAEQAGRQVEADFEKGFGGFNQMMAKVGAAYAAEGKSALEAQRDVKAMFDAETQGGDAAAAAVKKVQDVIDRQATLAQKASVFGPSKTELAAMAKDAADTYQFMLTQGTFTADQLAAAFKASEEAQAASLGINTEATKANLSVLQKGLDDLVSRRDTLWQQVSAEAPEAVMGVIETAQRAQLGVLDDQIAAQHLAIEKEAADAAAALKAALEGITPNPVHVPVIFDYPDDNGGIRGGRNSGATPIPQASGGDYMVTRPTLFLAGEAGPERATFTPGGRSRAADGGSGLQTEIAALSEAIARLPRTLSRAVKDGLVGMNG